MTQARIFELQGGTYRSTVKVDWLIVAGLVALGSALVCLALDIYPDLLARIVRAWRGM